MTSYAQASPSFFPTWARGASGREASIKTPSFLCFLCLQSRGKEAKVRQEKEDHMTNKVGGSLSLRMKERLENASKN